MASESWVAQTDQDRRLTDWQQGTSQFTWQLSDSGNWTQKVIDGIAESRSHDATNQVLQINGNFIQHDQHGNVTVDQRGAVHGWNSHNMLTSFQLNGPTSQVSASYRYDALDRRVAKEVDGNVTYFVHSGWQIVASTIDGVSFRKFAYAAFPDDSIAFVEVDNSVYWTHNNHRFDVYAITDANGQVVQRNSYGPFGEFRGHAADGSPLEASQCLLTEIAYRGRPYDEESGEYYFRTRQYSPVLGRFLSRDRAQYIDGTNMYAAYFAPHQLDPLGTATCTVEGANYELTGSETIDRCLSARLKCRFDCVCDNGRDPENGRSREKEADWTVDLDPAELPGPLNPMPVDDLDGDEKKSCEEAALVLESWIEFLECSEDDPGDPPTNPPPPEEEPAGPTYVPIVPVPNPIRRPRTIQRTPKQNPAHRPSRTGPRPVRPNPVRPNPTGPRPVRPKPRLPRRIPRRIPVRPAPVTAPIFMIPWPWEFLWELQFGPEPGPGGIAKTEEYPGVSHDA